MVLEASKLFVESLRERVRDIKLKKSADDALVQHSLSIISDLLEKNDTIDFYSADNFKNGSSFSRIDFKTKNFDRFVKLFKLLVKKTDPKFKFNDLGDLKVFLVDLKALKEITGKDNNPLIVEISQTSNNLYRIRFKAPGDFCYCGRIHRKNRKWITWIWEGSIKILTMDRVDPFAPQIIFKGELDGKSYEVKTELDETGFNYEIISLEHL